MVTEITTGKKSEDATKRLQRENRKKLFRTIVQIVVLVSFATYIVVSIVQNQGSQNASSSTIVASSNDVDDNQESSFIAISYPGLTKSTSLDSKFVNLDVFNEQIEALKASGYVTISQADIINYYLFNVSLPKMALFLIFEDGTSDTTKLAQDALEINDYVATICTYANSLDTATIKFITADDLKALLSNGHWELGTNGYRLSYINVFDRYKNYIGHLNIDEFIKISNYLSRDYNHYLMDFMRNEDGLREESVDELKLRIQKDYQQMTAAYSAKLGLVPNMYILMHSNTGAFATDPIASNANRDGLTESFAMNFNRQGSCLNTLDSSIYDLSRLQTQGYFSTNHLLMRIKDDTQDDVAFVIGDEHEANHWYLDDGVAQFKGNEIILTTDPRGEGRMTLKPILMPNLDIAVTLQGNLVGCQSINLRTDRSLKRGVQVSLENNELVVRDLTQDGRELFRRSMFEFDGGPFISKEEDEHNNLVALQKAIIQYDEDPDRVSAATAKLTELENTPVLTLEDGGTPYYPELDVSDRGSHKLRIRLVGSRLSIWVDDKPMVEQLLVSNTEPGTISFSAKVYADKDEYSQRNDDVYDAVFIDPMVYDADNLTNLLYAYTLTQRQTINSTVTGWFNAVVDFFLDNF